MRRWWAKQDPREARARRREYQRRYRVYTLGMRVERWVADVIRREFPGHEIIINDRKALADLAYALSYTVRQEGDRIVAARRRLKQSYQLNIYLPEIRIAFDVRGIHHFDPSIKGAEGLARVQECDRQREQLCLSVGILLIVVDIYYYRWTEEGLIRYIRRQIDASNYENVYSQITVEHDSMVSVRQYGGIVVVEEVSRSVNTELAG